MSCGKYDDESKRLRALASNPAVRYKFTDHSIKEIANDKLKIAAIKAGLKRCFVDKVEQNRFEPTWNAVCGDLSGNQMTIVVVPYEDCIKIKVITAWANDRR